jgi:isoleucyl-tRNA synthetase
MDDEVFKTGKSLRELGLDGVETTQWVPAPGKNRIHAMISGRPDWCISRQRSWGTPITVLRCTECGEPLVSSDVFEKAAKAIERGGVEAWAELPLEELLPAGSVCTKCGSKTFQKETDILDVWIDSGVSASVVCDTSLELSRKDYGKFIYLEGSDQHRGWFHSSLLFNLAAIGEKPYQTVVTHGFVLDGKGQKMSKSLGNVITPDEIMKTLGADILRWWAASSAYREDVRISKEILDRGADAYRKIRNTMRFMLGALADFDSSNDWVEEEQWSTLDVWVWSAYQKLAKEVVEAYRNFDFLKVTQMLLSFCQLELSSRYFEIIKDRLYCDALDNPRRRSCRTVLFKLSEGLSILLAPVLSFLADEVWENIPGVQGHVFEQRFQEIPSVEIREDWERFWVVREAVQAAMEPHRASKLIGTSLDASVSLALPPKDLDAFGRLGEDVEDLLVVSGLQTKRAEEMAIEVQVHSGTKCPRCWNHRGGAGQGDDADLCPRCWDVVKAEA